MAMQQGTVKSYNPDKGFGFIELAGSADVFFMRSENKDFATKGDSVSFLHGQGERGPMAKEVRVLARESGGYLGTVKSFNPTKGFGFIECEQTQAMYNKDVFFMKSSLGGSACESGAKVTFQVQESEKGPHAVNVKVVGGMNMKAAAAAQVPVQGVNPVLGQLQGVPGVQELLGALVSALTGQVGAAPPPPAGKGGKGGMGMHGGMGMMQQAPQHMGHMGGMGKGGMQGGMGMMNGGKTGGSKDEGKVAFGTVKNFNHQKGWGFLQTNSGEDVFVMGRAVQTGSLNMGDLVVFTKTQGPKGYQAENVQQVQAHELTAAYQGTVKNFNAEKGWGFISNTNAPKFGDIFVHKQDLGGQMVSVGDTLEFTIKMNNSGRPQADNVQVVGSGGGGYVMGRAGMAGQHLGYSPY
eukprot:TRINITY_DN110_c0_g1_i2.p2 TRINITY_DN110_c0_g1~~TRINITY_DN110_c0_g1_i2.p2  ORF type:complete len:408 (-),score=140.51 TRINITY_DN110_c0_g1_i2:82-1305(-)